MTRQVSDEDEEHKGKTQRIVDHVVEQRVSNLGQGLLTLGTMTGPLLIVLHLIPQGVLAGLFLLMGVQALEGNGITLKMLYLAKDRSLISGSDPLTQIERKKAIWVFVGIELLGFAATFAITQTIAAIGFPIFILALIPVRTYLLPKYFTNEELNILDAPTASPFTMISVGGNHGEDISNLPSGANSGNAPAHERPAGTDQFFTADDNDELERGEGSKVKQRQPSFKLEGADGDAIEMQRPGMSRRRSQSRQTRSVRG